MRILSFSLLISMMLVCNPSWAVSQEQYNYYYNAKLNGDFPKIMEIVTYIIKNVSPENLSYSEYEILATGLGFYHQFDYEYDIDHGKAFVQYFQPPGTLQRLRTLDAVYFAWYLHWDDEFVSDMRSMMLNWDAFGSDDVEGGMSLHVWELVNWKLAEEFMYENKLVASEMRMLEGFTHGQETNETPWEAVLNLSRISHLYHVMGKNTLAMAVAGHAYEILTTLEKTPHLYLSQIIANLATVTALNGNYGSAEYYLSLIDELDNVETFSVDKPAQLVISTVEAYLALRALDSKRLTKARERHKKSGWDFDTINDDYFFKYATAYIDTMSNQDCSNRKPFDSSQIEDQSIGNVMRVLEIDVLSFCGDFRGLEKLLYELKEMVHESTVASYMGLSRSLESSAESVWAEELVLKALLKAQEKKGSLNRKLTDLAIEFFLKSESSPAERELEALNLAREADSPMAEGNVRAYFNLLRERDTFLGHLFKQYTQKIIKRTAERLPSNMGFEALPNVREGYILDARQNVEEYLTKLPSRTIDDIKQNLVPGQAAIFNIERGVYQLTCFVSIKKHYCEINEKNDQHLKAIDTTSGAIKNKKIMGVSDELNVLADFKFPEKIRRMARKSLEVFYVPTKDDWRLPINLLWQASAIPSDLIVTPTLSGLTHRDNSPPGMAAKYSYTGIGNPDYQIQSIASLSSLEQINGFSLRSAGYIEQLASLSQLPATEQEVELTRQNFNQDSQVFLGPDANEDTLMDTDWYDAEIIHFATHALISGEFKGLEEPAIALSRPARDAQFDGLLTATDIRGFNFPSSTVILSGCRTATDYGKHSSDGITGLSLAFLTQGARNLLATQWQVPDKSSAMLVSQITKNLSEEVSASSISRARQKISSKYTDPFEWAAYIFISIPSRYNSEKRLNTHTTGTSGVISSDEIPIDASYFQIGDSNFIGVSGKQKDNNQRVFKIFKLVGNNHKLISIFEGYYGTFIDDMDEPYAFLESNTDVLIVKFNDAMTTWERQIQLFNTNDKTVKNYPIPKSSGNEFVFAYKGGYTGDENLFVKLIKVDFELEDLTTFDITNDVFEVITPKHYIKDAGWYLSVKGEDISLAIARSFHEPFYEPTRGIWRYPIRNHTYFYNYKNTTLESRFYRLHTNVLGVMDSPEHMFIASAGRNNALALVSSNGELLNVNEEISDIDWVRPFQSGKEKLLAVSSYKAYSEDSYYGVLKSSLDLVAKDNDSWSGFLTPDDVVDKYVQMESDKNKDVTSDEEFASVLSFLSTKKWIYQNSIVNPLSPNLKPVITFPSTPVRQMPLSLFWIDGSLRQINLINYDRRLEWETVRLKSYQK